MTKTILMISFFIIALSGCMTYDPYTGKQKTSNATTRSIIGVIGGALIGAASGALLWGGTGYYMDRQEAELRHRLQNTGVRVMRNGNNIELIMPGNITFDVNQTTIKPSFGNTLNSLAIVLKEFENTIIQI